MRRALTFAVLLIVLAAGCSGDDDDAVTTTTTMALTTTTSLAPGTTTAPRGAALVDPADTARAWIAAIAGGDDEGAIALTSDRSLEAVGGADGFAEREIELAEGWGVWDSATAMEVTAVELPDAPGVAIVILHGEAAHEGPPEEAWAALPVVATPDGDRVEPFIDLGTIEADPPANSEIPSSTSVRAFALVGRDVHTILDNDVVQAQIGDADGDQQQATVEVSDLEPGLHALTVVLTNEDGVMAWTFPYVVEA
jgi:hypothetical protein